MIKEKLKKQAKTLYLYTEDGIIDEIVSDWNEFKSEINHLKNIDIKNAKRMTRVDQTAISLLREDVSKITFDKVLFLKNAPEVKDGYVLFEKVLGENDEL